MNCPNCGAAYEGEPTTCPSCNKPLSRTLTDRVDAFASKAADAVDNAIGPDGFAPVAARYAKRQSISSLIFLIVLFIILAVVFTITVPLGLPIYIAAIFLGFTLALIALTLYNRKRISQIDLSHPENYYKEQLNRQYGAKAVKVVEGMNTFGGQPVKLNSDEEVVGFASPVQRNQSTVTGPSGVAVQRYTENTIMVTNQRIIFITCPMPGQGLMINGGSQDMTNDLLKRRTVRELSQKMVENLKGGGTAEPFPNDYWIDRQALTEVDYIKTVGPMKYAMGGTIGFKVTGGKKAVYNVVEGSDVDTLVPILHAVKKRFMVSR